MRKQWYNALRISGISLPVVGNQNPFIEEEAAQVFFLIHV
jgi:hypothetical protein